MPRKLPWLTQSTAKAKQAASSSEGPKAARPAKRQRLVTPEFDEYEENEFIRADASNVRKGKERAERAMSSSPIRSSAEEGPPPKEYMKEGIGADDDWMMVEDEFLATATLFTKHLHQAEYARLRKLHVETKPTAGGMPTLQNGKMPAETKNRLSAEAKATAQWNLIQKSFGYEEGEHPSSPERSNLRGLTKGPPPSAVLSANPRQPKPKPRRDSSPPQRRRETTTTSARQSNRSILAGAAKELNGISASDDSDDLDAPARPRQSAKPAMSRAQKCFGGPNTSKSLPLSPPQRPPDPQPLTSRKPLPSSATSKPISSSRLSTSDFLDDFKPRKSQKSTGSLVITQHPEPPDDLMSRIAKRRAERARKQADEKKKSVLLEEIPTFLV
ncbi:uncharacterized protein BDZ99DRAFT_502294 [Mytilinidion resinicola]|uniref:Uncharacterized protein n=1 Tax=Mytilinidion resinicola TaxID=574789 RepID=A0A6A6YAI9_9PEZI|nr:uncharacterized protein BDZ99DRAFT_502294 [Mytilinidion resinicola]KAF2804847.1 hypothetical protein BDZ99DRAFT_502294 [Mytilinidion resinicola]